MKMAKEKKKKKCTERAKIFKQAMESCHSNNPIDCIEWFADRIVELKAENEQIKNSDTLCKLIGEQKRKITDLEEQIEKMKNRKVFLLQIVDADDHTVDNQCYTTDEEIAKEWDEYYKPNYCYGQATELEEFSDKERIREELES